MNTFQGVVALCSFFIVATAQNCGVSSISNGRVIGGQDAKHGAWPWQILLLNNNQASCGGTIIGPYHIVTASHCVVDRRSGRVMAAYRFTVRVGDNDRRYKDTGEQDYRVSKVFSHPSFSYSTMSSDVTVLQLSSPIRFNNYVKPACLPSAPAPVGTKCYITGWGRNNRNVRAMHTKLQQAQMPIISTGQCAYFMRRVARLPIGSSNLCSGYGRTRVSGCQGDSGGPFVCQINGKWELHGAVSWGSQDCSSRYNEYTVYANIFNLKSWILRYARV